MASKKIKSLRDLKIEAKEARQRWLDSQDSPGFKKIREARLNERQEGFKLADEETRYQRLLKKKKVKPIVREKALLRLEKTRELYGQASERVDVEEEARQKEEETAKYLERETAKAVKREQLARVERPIKAVSKAIEGEYKGVQSGVRSVASKIFKEDASVTASRRRAMAQQQKVAKAVSYEEQQYLRRVQAAQQAAREQARKMQEYLASLNEQEAVQFLEQNKVQVTEVGEDGTIYPNKWNRKLAYLQMYFNAREAAKRFHEKPKDWHQRKYELEQAQMQRQREDFKRNNLLRAHESGVKAPLNWMEVNGTRANMPNVFSKNNPANQNVFDERGKANILNAPNVFNADRADVAAFNPLRAQRLFGLNDENSNIFSRRSKFHQDVFSRKQPNILNAPNVFNGSSQVNFGKVELDNDYGEQDNFNRRKTKSKKMKPIKMNLWRA